MQRHAARMESFGLEHQPAHGSTLFGAAAVALTRRAERCA